MNYKKSNVVVDGILAINERINELTTELGEYIDPDKPDTYDKVKAEPIVLTMFAAGLMRAIAVEAVLSSLAESEEDGDIDQATLNERCTDLLLSSKESYELMGVLSQLNTNAELGVKLGNETLIPRMEELSEEFFPGLQG